MRIFAATSNETPSAYSLRPRASFTYVSSNASVLIAIFQFSDSIPFRTEPSPTIRQGCMAQNLSRLINRERLELPSLGRINSSCRDDAGILIAVEVSVARMDDEQMHRHAVRYIVLYIDHPNGLPACFLMLDV